MNFYSKKNKTCAEYLPEKLNNYSKWKANSLIHLIHVASRKAKLPRTQRQNCEVDIRRHDKVIVLRRLQLDDHIYLDFLEPHRRCELVAGLKALTAAARVVGCARHHWAVDFLRLLINELLLPSKSRHFVRVPKPVLANIILDISHREFTAYFILAHSSHFSPARWWKSLRICYRNLCDEQLIHLFEIVALHDIVGDVNGVRIDVLGNSRKD